MKTTTLRRSSGQAWSPSDDILADSQLVLYFGTRSAIASGDSVGELSGLFPKADIVGCSTGGQIFAADVSDDDIVAMAFDFARTRTKLVTEICQSSDSTAAVGMSIGAALAAPDLKSIFVLSDGLQVNGSALVAGITGVVGPDVILTGGLAGDGSAFQTTLVSANGVPRSGLVAAIGFYGDALIVGHGSAGGWDAFGPRRKVTRSRGNVLQELDGKPALDLYERYLGDEAAGLPGTALLYPLLLIDPNDAQHGIVRTVLSIDRTERTMTFAGNVPENWSAQLMRGYFDRLADGAADAARQSLQNQDTGSEIAAIMVSCIGRRLLMGQNVIDELDATSRLFGASIKSLGFYSYGEISPHAVSGTCDVHNQTMTVTTFSERM